MVEAKRQLPATSVASSASNAEKYVADKGLRDIDRFRENVITHAANAVASDLSTGSFLVLLPGPLAPPPFPIPL